MAVIGGLSAGCKSSFTAVIQLISTTSFTGLADYLSRKHTLLIGGLSAMIGGALSAVSFHTL